MRARVLAAAGVAVVVCSGCGVTPGTGAVTRTADAWLAAARARDAAALCRLVTPAAAQSAETGDETCVQALADLDFPGTGRVGAVQVWSDRAQVKAGGDTLFLTEVDGGWRVSAAGCTAEADGPDDCDLEG
jgi:ketosteroid isomerase-like protein